MKKLLITLCCISIRTLVLSVDIDTIPYVISADVISQGIIAHDSSDYQQALALYELVQPGDSNYVRSLSQRAYAYMGLEDYPKAIEYYKKGLSMSSGYRAAMISSLGSAYDNTGDREMALKVFDEGLEKYPYYYQLHFNRAITLMLLERYEEAVDGFQQTIMLRPFHVSSHYYLSKIMMKQDLWAKAMMSMGVYLAVNPSYNKALVEINNLVNDGRREDGDILPFIDNSEFNKLDLLLKSRIAVKDAYETGLQFRPYIASQLHLFFDQITYKDGTDDFWMNFYVPFYTKLKEEGAEYAFIYSILSSTGNEKAQTWLEKNEKLKDKYIEIANNVINKNRDKHKVNIDGSEKEYSFWYYNSGAHNAIGNQISDDHFIGPWEFYHSNNELQMKGTYNTEGDKTGKWSYYDIEGNLTKIEELKDGELSGTIQFYYPSGQIRSVIPYKNNQRNGLVKIYYECGSLKEEAPYMDDQLHGSGKVYNIYGGVDTEFTYVKGKMDGDYKKFHRDGSLASLYPYKGGMVTGTAYSHYDNGQKEFEATYAENKFSGAYKRYHKNGQVSEEGIYKDGNLIGEWKLYFPNGQAETMFSYNEDGALDGHYLGFTKNGDKFYDLEYLNGMIIKATYFGVNGEVIGESGNNEGNFKFKRYYPSGQLAFECDLIKGEYNGAGTSYHKNGARKLVSNYKDDIEVGAYTEYYKNGKLASQGTLKDGVVDQFAIFYDIHGNKTSEGWTIEGESDQTWQYYYPDGTISEGIHYASGVRNGWTYDYDPDGKVNIGYLYKDNENIEVWQYDTTGTVFNKLKIENNKETQSVVYKFRNGNKRSAVELQCGSDQLEGKSFYLSGNLAVHTSKTFGQDDGSYIYKNPVSTTLSEGNSIKGEMTGLWKHYNGLGLLTQTSEFQFDKRHGEYKNYYYNGGVEVAVDYEYGERVRVGTFYDPDGNMQIRKHYDLDGEVVGFDYERPDGTFSEVLQLQYKGEFEVKAFFKNGTTSAVLNYKDGYLHGPSIYYNIAGKVVEEIDYIYGEQHGSAKRYYNDGTLLEEKEYSADRRTGIYKLYHPNGKKAEVSNWLSGVRHGVTQYFDDTGKEVYSQYYINDLEY